MSLEICFEASAGAGMSEMMWLSQGRNGKNVFQLVPGGHDGDCEVRLAYDKEDSLPRSRNMDVEELKKQNEKIKQGRGSAGATV